MGNFELSFHSRVVLKPKIGSGVSALSTWIWFWNGVVLVMWVRVVNDESSLMQLVFLAYVHVHVHLYVFLCASEEGREGGMNVCDVYVREIERVLVCVWLCIVAETEKFWA